MNVTFGRRPSISVFATISLIDILGFKNYLEVFVSHKSWLEEVKDALLEIDEINGPTTMKPW